MKYHAIYTTDGENWNEGKAINDVNKNRLASIISDIANLRRPKGGVVSWGVFDEEGKLVAGGYTDRSGRRHRTATEK